MLSERIGRRRFGPALALFLILLLSGGCGYHIAGKGGKMPGGITTISIPVFVNQTGKPDIEATLTTSFAEEFRTTVEVTGNAEARLDGQIISYNLKAVSYTKNDINLEYRLTVVLELRLIAVETGTVIWKADRVVDYEDFIVVTSDVTATDEAEIEAFKKLSTDTARNVKERMMDNF
jgi:outer membrane lipopolysaccharide assembly protein LptE/RlpB